MLRFTPKQVTELSTIIDRHSRLFVGVHVGRDFLSQSDLDSLAQQGITLPPTGALNYLESAFRFGLLSVILGNEVTKHFKYADFKAYLEKGNFLPLTGLERRALDHVRTRAYHDITGLGNRIVKDVTGDTLINDRNQAAQYRDLIQQTTADAVEQRLDARQLASALANKTKDWARDFHRIADYLMHEAFDTARAQGYLKLYGPGALVFKDVYAQACPTCQRLYLTGAIGSEPRTFTLLEMLGNGTNVGRKAAELKAVIGPTHPYCRCTLNYKPLGSVWDDAKQQFVLGRYTDPNASARVRNRTSRVKVTKT